MKKNDAVMIVVRVVLFIVFVVSGATNASQRATAEPARNDHYEQLNRQYKIDEHVQQMVVEFIEQVQVNVHDTRKTSEIVENFRVRYNQTMIAIQHAKAGTGSIQAIMPPPEVVTPPDVEKQVDLAPPYIKLGFDAESIAIVLYAIAAVICAFAFEQLKRTTEKVARVLITTHMEQYNASRHSEPTEESRNEPTSRANTEQTPEARHAELVDWGHEDETEEEEEAYEVGTMTYDTHTTIPEDTPVETLEEVQDSNVEEDQDYDAEEQGSYHTEEPEGNSVTHSMATGPSSEDHTSVERPSFANYELARDVHALTQRRQNRNVFGARPMAQGTFE